MSRVRSKPSESVSLIPQSKGEEFNSFDSRFLDQVIKNVPAMLGYWDRDLVCRFANDQYSNWFGKGPKETVGLQMKTLLGEELFKKNEGYVLGALRGEKQTFERSLRKPNGVMGHMWAQYVPDVGADGKVLGFFVLVSDITDLRESERIASQLKVKVQEGEEKFRAIVENIVDYSIIMLDPNGTISTWNSGATKLKGYTPEEAIGRHFSMFFLPEDRAAGIPQSILTAAREHGNFHDEGWRVRKSGERFLANFSVTPIVDSLGNLKGFTKIVRDVTHQRKQEDYDRFSQNVDRVLGIATNESELIRLFLKLVSEHLDWRVGLFWKVNPDGNILELRESYCDKPGSLSSGFIEGSKAFTFKKGEGLSGIAWERKNVVWLEEIENSNHFPRKEFVKASRLISGFSLPLGFGGTFFGCVEFFSDSKVVEDPAFIERLSVAQKLVSQRLEFLRTKDEFERSSNWMTAILDGADQSVISTDIHGMIRTFNRKAESLLGYSAKEVIGKATPAFIHDPKEVTARAKVLSQELGRSVSPGFEVFTAKLRPGISDENTWTYVHKDGQRIPVQLTYTALYNSQNETTGYLGIASDMSEKLLSEKRLKESERKLKYALEGSSDGVWDWDLESGEFDLSPAFAQTFGYPEKLDLKSVDDMSVTIHPDDWQRTKHSIESHLEGRTPQHEAEARLKAADGSWIWVLTRGKVSERNADGAPIRMTGVHIQINHIKKFEEELTRSHRLVLEQKAKSDTLLLALDSSAIVAITDPRGKIKFVNDLFCKISGYSREEVIGKDHRILNSKTHPKSFFSEMWDTISSGKVWKGEVCNQRKNGETYWLASTFVPQKNLDGETTEYIAIRFDITQEKLQQLELKETNATLDNLKTRLEVALHDSDIGVWEWEIPNNKLIWDDQMFRIYGTSREKFSNSYDAWSRGLHPDDAKYAQEEIALAVEGKKEFKPEFRVVKENGDVSYVMGRGKVIRSPDGKPLKMVGINWDITKIKENELALEEARALAAQAADAKALFLASMSHEIRTPLNGIIGMTALLEETQLSPSQREFVDTISQSGKTLLTIINDILDFSKIDAGKMELELVEFNFVHHIKDILKPFHYTAEKKGLFLKLECPEYGRLLWGDHGRIGQVVSNLLSNAIKFTKKGGITVQIRFEDQGDHSDIKLSVRDTGIGIPDEAKARMFQAFSQAEKSTSRDFGGTGLGLSISKKLSEMMGGSISFECTPKVGTTFTVRLPLKVGRSIKGPKQSQTQNQNQSQSQSQSIFGRVLVAEDNPTNQLVLARMLDKWGCKYHMVANGGEALDALRDAYYDLVLMDCQMPEMDGYTASIHIRNSDTLPTKIPIIALTANAVKGDEKRCREAGMDDYLSKPIDKSALESILRKYMNKTIPLASPSLIDPEVLKQFDELQVAGQPEILVEIIDSFFKTSKDRIAQLSDHLKSGNLAELSRSAHALKSSALTIGATVLGNFCQELEDLPSVQVVPDLPKLLEKLEAIYLTSCSELEAIRTRQRSQSNSKAA